MDRKPNIYCLGMLDTKFEEIKFLAKCVEEAGGNPIFFNMALGHEVEWADIKLKEILDSNGTDMQKVFASPRSAAIEMVGKAGAVKIMQDYEAGKVDGAISWAGSIGTSTVCYALRALPHGVPKIMMTDMASSDVSMWLGNKDIYIMNPTAEQGINVVTTKMCKNAAAAIVAMAKVQKVEGAKPLMAITAYGTTTPPVNRCHKYFRERGWDTMTIHQVGSAGATMEDLIRSGDITAVIDMTTGELTNTMYNSVYGMPKTWEGKRCTAAADVGIPQIMTPGGCDQAAYNGIDPNHPENFPFYEDYQNGKRRPWKDTKLPYIHNAGVSIMYPTHEEVEELGHYYCDVLKDTKGPTAFIIPMQGWSAYDQRAEICTRDRGWSEGNGDAPQWEPSPENPTWSWRSTILRDVMEKEINKENDNLDFMLVDMHMMDVEWSDLCCQIMDDMINGKWKKGMYRDVPGVIR